MDPFQAEKLDQIIALLKQLVEQTRPKPELKITLGPGFPNEQILAPIIHASHCQLIEAQRGWWSIVPPACTCGAIYNAPLPRTFTTTTTAGLLDALVSEKNGGSDG